MKVWLQLVKSVRHMSLKLLRKQVFFEFQNRLWRPVLTAIGLLQLQTTVPDAVEYNMLVQGIKSYLYSTHGLGSASHNY